MNPVWMEKDLTSHIFHPIYQFAFFLFALKKPTRKTCGLTSLLNQLKLQGFFVYEGIVQFEEERIGTVICDLGQSSTLAF